MKNKIEYVIRKNNQNVIYYYMESNQSWTPLLEGATHYQTPPKYDWFDNETIQVIPIRSEEIINQKSESKNSTEKIILVYYVNVKGKSTERIHELMGKLINSNSLPKDPNIITSVIPVKDRETEVVCINPKLLTNDEYQAAKQITEDYNQLLKRELENLK